MWSSLLGPHEGLHFMPAKQQQRKFGMDLHPMPIAPGKTFKNPNFVNNFNKYQNTVKSVDSNYCHTKNDQNLCHSQIIDSIKEKCPEVIPCVEEINNPQNNRTSSDTFVSSKTIPDIMCHSNNKSSERTRAMKREHSPRKNKRHSNRKSRQNRKRQEVMESLQEEETFDVTNNSVDFTTSPHHSMLHLEDFLFKENKSEDVEKLPVPGVLSEKLLCNTKHSDIILPACKLSPPPTANSYMSSSNDESSTTEDSFVIYNGNGNGDIINTMKSNDYISISDLPPSRRDRQISVCESEDSFIIFDGEDIEPCIESDNESECSFDLGDSESNCGLDQEDFTDSDVESTCTEDDSSFSIVEPKRVRFAADDKLCEVHPMIKWSYAYQAARKGPWEMFARDRYRFKDRISRLERQIKHIFDPEYRDKIYKERFDNDNSEL